MFRFILFVLALSLALAGGTWLGVEQGYFRMPTFAFEIIGFLAFANIVGYGLVERRLSAHPQDFVTIYLGATVLRLLTFAMFIALVIWLSPESDKENTLLFLVSYLLFTVLEVVALYARNAKR